jgi:hypothetical protein
MTRDHFEDKHTGENNIKMSLKEIHWEGRQYLAVAVSMGQVAGSCEHGDEPLGSIKCSSCWTVRLSRRTLPFGIGCNF